ncbi:MAG: hypothetical protein GX225_06080 [Clostridiales bacterium]|nr:hypothetical protein [Clostridiales bacterium]
MAEKLYTIPVNEVFEKKCECPICEIYHTLEKSALEFTMGPSYMEDDIRAMTDATGFCKIHSEKLLKMNNRLGMALILKTHTDKINKDISKMSASLKAGGMFKKADNSEMLNYIQKLNSSCFICNRIEDVFNRYIATVFYLWKSDESFKEKFLNSQGFCMEHFGLLVEKAGKELSGKTQEEFLEVLSKLYNDNMQRINEDLAWFINKFDYKYKDEPWKNAKDSVPRALIKLNGLVLEEEQ